MVPRPRPSWDRIWRLTRPLFFVAMAMHVGFFAALSLMAPVQGADVAALCTLMTVVVALSVYCVGRHWRERSNDMPAARRWMIAAYFCIPCYDVLAIVVGGRMGLLTTHLVRLLGNAVLFGALLGLAIFLLPGRVWQRKSDSEIL